MNYEDRSSAFCTKYLAGYANIRRIFDTGMSNVISEVIGPNFTKFFNDVAGSWPQNHAGDSLNLAAFHHWPML